jgi:uncharacterized protein (DUF608 family)
MPIRSTLKREHKVRSGLALGGIGAGWMELRKDGIFYNWNIFNNRPLGSGQHLDYPEDAMLFFIVRFEEKGKHPKMKLLQIDQGYEVATIPSHYYTFPWLTGVDEIECEQSFPFTKLTFRDADMPLEIDLLAWSPFIPHDAKNSALPCAIFDFQIRSTTSNPVDVMLLATTRNAVGYDTPDRYYISEIHDGKGYRSLNLTCGDMAGTESSYGQMALASLSAKSTWYAGWEHRHPYYEYVIRNKTLRDYDDTEGRNKVDDKGRKRATNRCFASIATSRRLTGKGKGLDHSFVLGWNFPNLYAGRTPKEERQGKHTSGRLEGHYYSNFFDSAIEVVDYVAGARKKLLAASREFHDQFRDSTAPGFVLDQVNSQLNTFLTSSWFTRAGDFGIQEGLTPEQCWGPLATIDVAMYGSLSTSALFPQLDKAMFLAHKRMQQPSGEIAHGIGRDFSSPDIHENVKGRLDLPSQYVIMALRAYLWSGDEQYLREIWPSVIKAIDYVLRERDMNGDLLPDMEGSMCTYDNFPMYGAASYVASLWLAALAYAAEAAREIGDHESERRFEEILEQARGVFEEKLFNGEYYRLYNNEGGPMGGKSAAGKVEQIDEGCLADQMIGQWATHFTGVEGVLKPSRVRKSLRAVLDRCYDEEYGLRNCRWPGEDTFLADVADDCWSDQHNTAWSGVELAFASFLIYEGLVKQGLEVTRNVDDRYRKAGMYFDHQEFGGHYFRPMSAWGILHALAGAAMHGPSLSFEPQLKDKNQKLFVAFAGNTGHFVRKSTKTGQTDSFEVASGRFQLKDLTIETGLSDPTVSGVRVKGKALARKDYDVETDGKTVRVTLRRKATLTAGKGISVTIRG